MVGLGLGIGSSPNMFSSQILVSKKGALGIVWIAAHCHKKLNKDQVCRTDIISSVETILKDEVPTVTHRILAYLLLGVVRIYSKKVEYLADDCRQLLATIRHIPKGNQGLPSLHSPYHSITLPERFELDSFDFQGLGNQDLSSDHTVRSTKDIMLPDSRNRIIMGFHSHHKYNEGSSSHREALMTTSTPVKDVLSPHFMDIDIDRSSLRDTRNIQMSLENNGRSMFFLDDCLEPMTFEDLEYEKGLRRIFKIHGDEKINMENIHERSPSRYTTNLMMGLQNVNKGMFVLDDRMEPMTFDDHENEVGLHGLCGEEIQTVGEQIIMENIHETGPSSDTTNLIMGLENINKSMFVLDDRVEPMTFEEPENEGGLHGLFEKEIWTESEQTNIENISGEAKIQSSVGSLPGKKIHTDGNNSGAEIYLEGEPVAITKVVSKEKNVETEIRLPVAITKVVIKEKNMETEIRLHPEVSSESRISETPKDHHVSIPVHVTPQSKFPAHSGEVLPEIMAIQTPAAKEHKRVTQKRKCYYDDQLVLPNEIFKLWINDSSDLVCKRRKVPHTSYYVWEAQKISRLPESFLDPLISCNSLDCRDLIIERAYRSGNEYQPAPSSCVGKNQSVPGEQNKTASSFSTNPNQSAPLLFQEQNQYATSVPEEQNHTAPPSPAKQSQISSLLTKGLDVTASVLAKVIKVSVSLAEEQTPHAPSVSGEQERAIPVNSTLIGYPEFEEVHGLGILEPATPVESMEKCRSPSDDETSDISFADEEMNPYEGAENEKNYLSVRTRKVAGYLYRKFAQKKRGGDESINLSRVVKGKNKKESARLFYEILVLKTKDCIKVRQKKAYEDIQVMQTPALKQATL